MSTPAARYSPFVNMCLFFSRDVYPGIAAPCVYLSLTVYCAVACDGILVVRAVIYAVCRSAI